LKLRDGSISSRETALGRQVIIHPMKSYTLRFRAADKTIFDEMKSGVKSIETRAATVKYKPIEAGDILVCVCGTERFSKRIARKRHFPSVDALLKDIDFKKIMPSLASVDEVRKAYSSYPGYEAKIKESGIFAFDLAEAD